jgi:5-methylthioribose kinase
VQVRLTNDNLFSYLEARGHLTPDADARCESPGEGNINWVRRVRGSDGASFIVKQARESLERFPEYQAPPQRIVLEARYYEVTAPYDTEQIRPGVLDFDPEHFVLILEDLGEAERLDEALSSGRDTSSALQRLGRFLGAVHGATRDGSLAGEFENGDMQRLHGAHIFTLPYRENDFPLSPRLRERAREIWADRELVARIDASYDRFLTPRGALVHADVQPGNLLLAKGRLVLLDAEIAHIGDPAFDAGTLLAHLLLAGLARPALDALELSRTFWEHYTAEHGAAGLPAFADVARYAGIEVLRRTLGAARVPAVESDETALAAVSLGRALSLTPPDRPQALLRRR